MKTLRDQFKPSLLTRILFEGGYNGGVQKGGEENVGVDLTQIDALQAPTPGQKEIPTFIDAFMTRSLVRVFILFLAMYVAMVVIGIPGVIETIFKDVDMSEPNSAEDGVIFKQRYKKLILFLLVFIIFTMIFQIIMYVLIKVLLRLIFEANAPIGTDASKYADMILESLFETFDTDKGKKNMKLYISIERYALLGIFLFFIVYFLLVKSFINLMTYPPYTDNPINEHRVERKFLVNYILTVIYFILFALGLVVAHYSYNDPVTFFVFIMFIAILALGINFTLSNDLRKNLLWFWVCMIIIIVLLTMFIVMLS
jgi:hypothetical protein